MRRRRKENEEGVDWFQGERERERSVIISKNSVQYAHLATSRPSRLRSELLALSLPLFRSRLKTILFDHGLVSLGRECL